MFCIKCGAQLNDGSAFCTGCGASMAPVVAEVAADVSPKSRLATSLLAWFLGHFGAHRFYAGKIGTAVVMLIITILAYTIMICAFTAMVAMISDEYWPVPFVVGMVVGGLLSFAIGIWSIVDFIIAVTGNFKDSQGRIIKKW